MALKIVTGDITKVEVDVIVNAGTGGASNLPKGIQKHTLEMISDYFKENTNWTTGDSVAEKNGVSIVTVRHYMNYLVQTGKIEEDINYETGGRPSMMYKKNLSLIKKCSRTSDIY